MPFAGHIGPLGAVAAELASRGHRVTGYTGAKYQGRFDKAVPWVHARDFDDADITATFPRAIDGRSLATDVILGTTAGQEADIDEAGPFDLVVTDEIALGGAVWAHKHGVPWVSVCVTPFGATSRVHSPLLVLAQGVPGLEEPRRRLPSHVHFVGRLAMAPARQALPDWWGDLIAARDQGRPVVHITQGTLNTAPDDLLRPAMTAIDDALVVCATGGGPIETLGVLPDNVRAAPFLPYDALLPLVDVMVSNGGWGGVLAAVEAGVPLVVAGGRFEKADAAQWVARSGVGIDLRTGLPEGAAVRGAAARVLAEPSFRSRARELSVAMSAAGGVTAAGALIDALS